MKFRILLILLFALIAGFVIYCNLSFKVTMGTDINLGNKIKIIKQIELYKGEHNEYPDNYD